MSARLEHLLDPVMWAWCWAAFHLLGPFGGTRVFMWLLPFAGFYAYHSPSDGTTWRWSERQR